MNLEKEKSYELDIEKYFMFLPEVADEVLSKLTVGSRYFSRTGYPINR
jgi:hypothetical protein